MEVSNEIWCEAELHRIAGEVALVSPQRDVAKAEGYFERALSVARQQQAKSWELRAAMSLARLWRDQGKEQQASELLAPVYGWFMEGFDTRDLKEARRCSTRCTPSHTHEIQRPKICERFGSAARLKAGSHAIGGRETVVTTGDETVEIFFGASGNRSLLWV